MKLYLLLSLTLLSKSKRKSPSATRKHSLALSLGDESEMMSEPVVDELESEVGYEN